MVKTRGNTRKRKIHADFEYDLEEIERQEEIERVLTQEAAKEEEALWAKQQQEEHKAFGNFFHAVPPEVLGIILSFVDNTRTLFNLSVGSKVCRNVVTQEMIVRAAVFADAKPTRNLISNVMELVRTKSIQTPSTFRLLRLVNGTRCERLEECFQYNLTTKTSADMTYDRRRHFGLCICQSCLKGVGTRINDHTGHLENDHLARAHGGLSLCIPQIEHATGESVGPVVMAYQVEQIATSFREAGDRKKALDMLFQKVDDELTDEEKTRRETLVDCYFRALSDFESWREAKSRREIEERQARQEERAANKRERGEAVLATIEALLDDYEHKEIVLAGHWENSTGIRKFTYAPSQYCLAFLTEYVSYSNPSSIKRHVREVREAYDLILANGFGTGESSDALAFLAISKEPHETALYDLKNDNFLSHSFTSRSIFCETGRNFVAALKEGSPLGAFLKILSWADKKTAFVKSVVDDETSEAANFIILAQAVWGITQSNMWKDPKTVDGYRRKYYECRTEYQVLQAHMKAYLRMKDVRKFLKLRSPPANRPNQVFSRKDALRRIFLLQHGAKELLQERQLDDLFVLHKRMFGDPWGHSDMQVRGM